MSVLASGKSVNVQQRTMGIDNFHLPGCVCCARSQVSGSTSLAVFTMMFGATSTSDISLWRCAGSNVSLGLAVPTVITKSVPRVYLLDLILSIQISTSPRAGHRAP